MTQEPLPHLVHHGGLHLPAVGGQGRIGQGHVLVKVGLRREVTEGRRHAVRCMNRRQPWQVALLEAALSQHLDAGAFRLDVRISGAAKSQALGGKQAHRLSMSSAALATQNKIPPPPAGDDGIWGRTGPASQGRAALAP